MSRSDSVFRALLLTSAVLFAGLGCRPAVGDIGEPTSLLAALPAGILEAPVTLDDGCGSLHQPVSTLVAEAQAFYDQGIACLATFDWVRAARSFHRALAADPNLAASYSGQARATLAMEEPSQALALAETGAKLTGATTPPWEKAWVDLAVHQMRAVVAPQASRSEAVGAYRQALDQYRSSFPEDPHGLALSGHAESRADNWGQTGGKEATRWYQRALATDPSYFPGHHFLAHSLENQGRYEEALEHARRFAELVPKAPHAHHMVAHTAPRQGRWQEAFEALQSADTLHRERFQDGELPPEADWHYSHNLRLTAAVATQLDKPDLARETYRQTFELPIGGHRGGFYCSPWIEFLLADEDDILALEASETCLRRASTLARVLGHAHRGEALINLGRVPEALEAQRQARRELESLYASLGPVSTEIITATVAERTVAILQGKLDLVNGRPEQGETLLAALGEELSQGSSFDAWASGRERLQELTGWAARNDAPRLAQELTHALARLERAPLQGPPKACH